jgi:hypothetical protein
VSSSFQFQVTNFIAAMAASITCSEPATQVDQDQHREQLQDFTPGTSDFKSCRILIDPPQEYAETSFLSAWMPSPTALISNLDLQTYTRHHHASEMQHRSVRDFGEFVAQLESPSASAFEHYDLQKIRRALCERSLTIADFRHAVDHQIDHASSIWQNN